MATRSTESPPSTGAAPRWEARALRELRASGVEVRRLRYPRGTGGEATGWLLSPRNLRRARLIYAHGTGNDALYPQVELARRLAAAGTELVLFDLDGHGRDASTVLAPSGAAEAFADAARAAPRLEEGVPLYLGGQSLGGALALKASATLRGVRGILGFAAPSRLGVTTGGGGIPPLAYEATSIFRAAVWHQLTHYGPLGIWPALGALKRDAYPIRLAAAPRATDGAKGAFAYVDAVTEVVASLGLGGPPDAATATNARPRALLLYGSRDKIVPPSEGDKIAAHWSDVRVVTVRGATHFSLPFERQALDEAVAFITSQPP